MGSPWRGLTIRAPSGSCVSGPAGALARLAHASTPPTCRGCQHAAFWGDRRKVQITMRCRRVPGNRHTPLMGGRTSADNISLNGTAGSPSEVTVRKLDNGSATWGRDGKLLLTGLR